MGYHFLLQVIFLTQGSNPSLLHMQVGSLPRSHPGSPWDKISGWLYDGSDYHKDPVLDILLHCQTSGWILVWENNPQGACIIHKATFLCAEEWSSWCPVRGPWEWGAGVCPLVFAGTGQDAHAGLGKKPAPCHHCPHTRHLWALRCACELLSRCPSFCSQPRTSYFPFKTLSKGHVCFSNNQNLWPWQNLFSPLYVPKCSHLCYSVSLWQENYFWTWKKKDCIIWLLQVLVVAHGIFSWSTWDLVSWSGIEPRPPALGTQSLSHWATREEPLLNVSLLLTGLGVLTPRTMLSASLYLPQSWAMGMPARRRSVGQRQLNEWIQSSLLGLMYSY